MIMNVKHYLFYIIFGSCCYFTILIFVMNSFIFDFFYDSIRLFFFSLSSRQPFTISHIFFVIALIPQFLFLFFLCSCLINTLPLQNFHHHSQFINTSPKASKWIVIFLLVCTHLISFFDIILYFIRL